MRMLSKAEFAREVGVTASAISKALKTILKDTVIEGAINADHPDAIRYRSRCGFVGRPHTSKNTELADFVTSRLNELKEICRHTPHTTASAHVARLIADNLFNLGFASKWMVSKEIDDRMKSIERNLGQLHNLLVVPRVNVKNL